MIEGENSIIVKVFIIGILVLSAPLFIYISKNNSWNSLKRIKSTKNRHFKPKSVNTKILTRSIIDKNHKKDVASLLKKSIIESNIISELITLKHEKVALQLVHFIEEKIRYKKEKNHSDTEFAMDLYNNALDMANEIIILTKSTQAIKLQLSHPRISNRKKPRFEWETVDQLKSAKIISIESEIDHLIESIQLLKETYIRLKKVNIMELKYKEEQPSRQSINELKKHSKGL